MAVFANNRPLLDAFRAGDKQALEQVYFHYVARVANLVRYGFLLERGGRVPGVRDPEAERELVHDIFVRAFDAKARLSFDGLRPYQPFLMRLAKNLLIDRWRRSSAAPPLELAPSDDELERAVETPAEADDDLHWSRLLCATQAWTAGLDEESRQYIQLRFVEELAQRDVAVRLGVTRRRVRTLEARIQKALRAHLEGKGF